MISDVWHVILILIINVDIDYCFVIHYQLDHPEYVQLLPFQSCYQSEPSTRGRSIHVRIHHTSMHMHPWWCRFTTDLFVSFTKIAVLNIYAVGLSGPCSEPDLPGICSSNFVIGFGNSIVYGNEANINLTCDATIGNTCNITAVFRLDQVVNSIFSVRYEDFTFLGSAYTQGKQSILY